MTKKDENQTPAPKVSSSKDLSHSSKDESALKASISTAKEGAAKKKSATKTPQKIQDGDTSEKKREY